MTVKVGQAILGHVVLEGPDPIDSVRARATEPRAALQPPPQVGVRPRRSHVRPWVGRGTLDLIECQCLERDFSWALNKYPEALRRTGRDERAAAPMLVILRRHQALR